jgi:hypothetical protein
LPTNAPTTLAPTGLPTVAPTTLAPTMFGILTEPQCEHDRTMLQCPVGTQLYVKKATFGRSDKLACGGDRNVCGANADVTAQVAALCSGVNRRQCAFRVDALTLGVQDPCQGVTKYLSLVASCVVASEPTKEVGVGSAALPSSGSLPETCRYDRMEVGCPAGQTVKITSAIWGRQKADVCASGLVTAGLRCNTDATALVRARCDGKDKCVIGTSYLSARLNKLADASIDPANLCYENAYLSGTYECVTL